MVRLATPFIRGIARCISPVVRRVRIDGLSMVPTYGPGEYVWLRRIWWPPRLGAVVATRDPDEPNREVIKRVVARHSGRVRLQGDNAAVSRDSRVYGDLPMTAVRWLVVPQRRP